MNSKAKKADNVCFVFLECTLLRCSLSEPSHHAVRNPSYAKRHMWEEKFQLNLNFHLYLFLSLEKLEIKLNSPKM